MKRSKLPIQAAPVARNITGAPMSNGNGVDPSFLGGVVDWVGDQLSGAASKIARSYSKRF